MGSKLYHTPSWVISTPNLVSKCFCLFYQTISSSLLLHDCHYFKLLKIKRQFREISYWLDLFFPLSFRTDLGPKQNYHFLLGLLWVNLVQPSDSRWGMPLLHPQSGWQQQWWVNAEQASESAAIFILLQGAGQLPPSKFSYHGVQKDALGAHHFPSHLPSITLKKLKSQVGELPEERGLSTPAMGMTTFGKRIWHESLVKKVKITCLKSF